MDRSVSLAVLAKRAPDVPGQWVAHCLHMDIVSQGDSLTHALEMVAEAVALLMKDDLAHGLNPLDRAPAPEEDWQELLDTLRYGTQANSGGDPDQIDAVVAQMLVTVRPPDEPTVTLAPPPWQIAAARVKNESAPPSRR